MKVNRSIEQERRRRIRAGYVLNHQDERSASLSRRGQARSFLLLILLLLVGWVLSRQSVPSGRLRRRRSGG